MVISIRVPRELKDEAVALGIDLRRLVVKALEEEIRARKVARLSKALKDLADPFETSEEEWVP